MDETTDVTGFYAGKTVLLTGGSGFLGKICLEKLLRATEVKRVYLLLRTKKDKEPQKRLEELFDGVAFDRLNKETPSFRERVTLIPADCRLPNLGISGEDMETLTANVDVIVHFAATVRFDENLKFATAINVRAVRDLIRLARNMPQLKAFLHVSTAFAHCPRDDIDEKFYETPLSGEQLISVTETLDEKLIADITPQFLGAWPNTYVFTKAVAENMVRTEGKGLPISVFRPSVVVASYKEPVPGWIDNFYGVTGVLIGSALGLIRIIRCTEKNRAEIVPADYVVNAAIAATWETSENSKENEVPVYNYVSTPQRPITWPIFMDLAYKHAIKIPSPLVIYHYVMFLTSSPLLYKIGFFLLHYVPAYIVDFIASCIGKKPMLVKGYQKIEKFAAVATYFAMREWSFKNDNVQALWKRLSEKDKAIYEFDIGSLHWDTFFDVYAKGCRQYLLKDTLDSIPAGKKKVFRLKVLHYCLCAFLLYICYEFVSFGLRMVL